MQITHGVDPQSRRAWFQAHVDAPMGDEPINVLPAGPVLLRLLKARFRADSRVDATLGQAPQRTLSGNISGNWELVIAGMQLVIFKETALIFDDAGGLRFSMSPNKIELPGVLSFIQDFMKGLSSGDNGVSFGFLPTGVQVTLSLPIPDIQVGTFGISNLRLGARLALQFADAQHDNQFTISLGFNLARRTAPFALTIFILGGGGYVETNTTFVPSQGRVRCRVEVGITACASLAIALGPIRGGVYVYVGINARFESGTSNGLTIGLMFLIRGEVSLLGIAEASISLLLEAKYETGSGRLIGHGQLTIKIKICWCFTLEIDEEITYTLGGDSNKDLTYYHVLEPSYSDVAYGELTAGSLGGPRAGDEAAVAPVNLADPGEYERLADVYISMLV